MRPRLPTLEVLDEDIVEVVTPPSGIVRRASTPSSERLRPSVSPVGDREAQPSRRESSLDQIEHDLGALATARTTWQAAAVCASALGKAVRAGAVLVHFRTPGTNYFRIVGAHGTRTHDLLGSSDGAGTDVVAATLLRTGKPVMAQFDGKLPRTAPARLRTVGATRSLCAVSVLVDGICVGFLEIVDAHETCQARVPTAIRLVANQLGQFLGARTAAA